MTNIDRAAEVLWLPEPHLFTSECDDQARELAQALADAGLLMPDQTIIRTVEELEALESEAIVQRHPQHPGQYSYPETAGDLAYVVQRWGTDRHLPAVVVAPAEQVRAARKALEEA